ncbi:MAG TPA: hypothetical protein VJ256_06020 [Dehalococcoidia bacterium]|nr:hypothetical protein [Dehalococcoidia bacterium]
MADEETGLFPRPPEVRHATTEILWRCGCCGYQRPREEQDAGGPPPICPGCGAPPEEFYLVLED